MEDQAHLITLISIIVGLGLTEMFGNFHRLIRNRSRVVWDWLPVIWAATLLVTVVNYWWSIYVGVSGLGQTRNAAEFGLLLITPALLFLTMASVLPNFGEAGEGDMRRYYGEQRRTFIVTFVLYQCSTWMLAIVIGTFGWNLASIARGFIIALLVMMLLLNRRRWDWIGLIAILTLFVVRLTTQAVR